MAQPMGLGKLGGSDIVFKRKYRWTFVLQSPCGGTIPEHTVKLAARPNLTIEETEINFLHGKMWIPGKGTWETITVTYYDLGNDGGSLTGLWSWLATVYDFTDPVNLKQASKRGGTGIRGGQVGTQIGAVPTIQQRGAGSGGYAGIGTLVLFDGCGEPMERWTLGGVWPQAINFGELDYSSSEEVTIELTLRYFEVKYEPLCGGAINPCCGGCTPSRQ